MNGISKLLSTTLSWACLLLTSSAIHAYTFDTVLSPQTNRSYWAGPNALVEFLAGDDILFPGSLAGHPNNQTGTLINNSGSTGSWFFADPTAVGLSANGLAMGFFQGSLTTAGAALTVGVNNISGLNRTYNQNIFGNVASTNPFSGTPNSLNANLGAAVLTAGQAHTMTINADGSFTADYFYEFVAFPQFKYHYTSTGFLLLAGEDPSAKFAGDQSTIDWFEFFLPNLNPNSGVDPNFALLGVETAQFDVFLNGSLFVTGTASQTFSSTDAGSLNLSAPVPVPASLALLLSALGFLVARTRLIS
ncbi:MAG: hypothetical protein AAF387_11060 [Pseudomonadota bacterium]